MGQTMPPLRARFTPDAGSPTISISSSWSAVGETLTVDVTVSGCNGHHNLCSRGYDQVRYATTHNAMSNATSGWLGPNQNWHVPAQLQPVFGA